MFNLKFETKAAVRKTCVSTMHALRMNTRPFTHLTSHETDSAWVPMLWHGHESITHNPLHRPLPSPLLLWLQSVSTRRDIIDLLCCYNRSLYHLPHVNLQSNYQCVSIYFTISAYEFGYGFLNRPYFVINVPAHSAKRRQFVRHKYMQT